jgi:predicted DCC family thiol-disulfide oxidoreductase YuxK
MQSSTEPIAPFQQKSLESIPIIFFDGECNLCNGFVDLLLQIDRDGIFHLSPLQGKTAAQFLPPLPNDREAWSIFYLDEHQLYSQSDAAIQIAKRLGGLWTTLGISELLPSTARDHLYRIVASNRYRWFGQRATCRVPTEQEQARFLP